MPLAVDELDVLVLNEARLVETGPHFKKKRKLRDFEQRQTKKIKVRGKIQPQNSSVALCTVVAN